jgi:hypothetical protein
MKKVNRALRERLLQSYPTNSYASLPKSVMPLTEEDLMNQSLEDLDLGDYEYDPPILNFSFYSPAACRGSHPCDHSLTHFSSSHES